MYRLFAVSYETGERFLLGEYERWVDGYEADSYLQALLNAVYTVLEEYNGEEEESGRIQAR